MRIFLLALCISFLYGSCNPREATSKEERLQTFLDSLYQAHPEMHGISVYIVKADAHWEWGGAAGLANPETQESLTVDHAGEAGSIAKTFTAAAVLKLIEKGQVDLAKPISQLLPDSTLALLQDHEYRADSIHLSHLLSHTSGLQGYTNTADWKRREADTLDYNWTREELLRLGISGEDPGPVGKVFQYADLNYLLLSIILEQQFGKPYTQAIRELVALDSLGLAQVWFRLQEKSQWKTYPLMRQYVASRGVSTFEEHPSFGSFGAAGIYAPARDLAHFITALFNEEVYRDSRTLQIMTTYNTPSRVQGLPDNVGDRVTFNYHLGLEELSGPGWSAYGHSGYWGSSMLWFPEEEIGMAFFILEQEAWMRLHTKVIEGMTKLVVSGE